MSETARRVEDCAAGAQVVLPRISIDTLMFCLTRLNGKDASVPIDDDLHVDIVSAEQLVGLVRDHRWEASLIHLVWPELRALLAEAPVLLILKNGNVVLATANNADPAADEIIVCDPLYSDGADFFVPRKALEAAWAGVALPVIPLLPPVKPLIGWLARFGAGVVLTGPLLLYPGEASLDQSTASLVVSARPKETTFSPPELEQDSAGAASIPLDSTSALLLLTDALIPVRKQETNTSDAESGSTRPIQAEPNQSPQLNPMVAAEMGLPPTRIVPPMQDVTILRGAGTRH